MSLTSCLGKLLEKAVADLISNWAETNNKFNRQQTDLGNTEVLTTIISNFQSIIHSFHSKLHTTAIFLDVEKAFDQVWFDGLLCKLTFHGIEERLLRWISDFLFQRELIISLDGKLSTPITPLHGVPQGSPLSPILFILYVSDIPQPTEHYSTRLS